MFDVCSYDVDGTYGGLFELFELFELLYYQVKNIYWAFTKCAGGQ